MGDRKDEYRPELAWGLENVEELEDALNFGIGWELEVEVEVTVVSLVVLAPVHLLVDPGVSGLEFVEIHADCLEELSGG